MLQTRAGAAVDAGVARPRGFLSARDNARIGQMSKKRIMGAGGEGRGRGGAPPIRGLRAYLGSLPLPPPPPP